MKYKSYYIQNIFHNFNNIGLGSNKYRKRKSKWDEILVHFIN